MSLPRPPTPCVAPQEGRIDGRAAALSFVRLMHALRASLMSCEVEEICVACGVDDDIRPLSVMAYCVDLKPVSLCHECHQDCSKVCDDARALIRSRESPAVDCPPLDVVIRRMVFVRARSALYRDLQARSWVPSARCLWCDGPTDYSMHSAEACVVVGTVNPFWAARAFPLHDRCWDAAGLAIRRAHVARCMASGAMRLPLWPEIRRQIALFIVQLTADGLEEAAVVYCLMD